MTNTFGDLPGEQTGDGSVTFPSQSFFSEPTTGVYRDTTNPSSTEWAVSKKGSKRLRITDTETEVIGLFKADSFVPGFIDLLDGSTSTPSLAFQNDATTGIYRDTSGGGPGIGFTNNSRKRVKINKNGIAPLLEVGSNSGTGIDISGTGTSSSVTLYADGSVALTAYSGGTVSSSISNNLTCGTNQITCGAISCGSTVSNFASISCGTTSLTCGSILSASTLPISVNGTRIIDITSTGVTQILRSQTWSTSSLPSTNTNYALCFASPSSTPAIFSGYLTYTQNSVTGDTWTINQAGIYIIKVLTNTLSGSGTSICGVSKNIATSTVLTSWPALGSGNVVALKVFASTNDYTNCCFTVSDNFVANDVIRICLYTTAGPITSLSNAWQITITYLGNTATSL